MGKTISCHDKQYRERMSYFKGPILERAMADPVMMKIIEMYAIGDIITPEEALNRMVIALSDNLQRRQKELIDFHMALIRNGFLKIPL